MKIRPIDDRVLVAPQEERYLGSLVIPDSAKEKPVIGEVIAIGNDYDNEGPLLSSIVKVGDKVIYGKYAGEAVELAGEKYLIISRSDLLAVIDRD